MSDPDSPRKGRVRPGYVELLIGFVLFIAFFFGALVPTLLWISQENLVPAPEQFAAVAVVTAMVGLLVISWLARKIVRGPRYTPEQRLADELRLAELNGQTWLYEYLRNMTPDEAAWYETRRRWFTRIFIVSALTAFPAGTVFDRPVLWFIPAAVLACELAWTYWRASRVSPK